MRVPFSYLDRKFKGTMDVGHPIYEGLKSLMETGDFTLGKAVDQFERKVEELLNVKHAIGVANGTDALRISLRLAGVGPGDEVITAANTFIASAGCADELFATPKFIDMADNYVLDPSKLESAITRKTAEQHIQMCWSGFKQILWESLSEMERWCSILKQATRRAWLRRGARVV